MKSKVLVDTNVLLRYILEDNEEMALTAELVIAGGAWTAPEFLAEMVYVLESIYGFSRDDICAALNTVYVKVETRPSDIVRRAIQEYENTKLDFVDCMMVAYAACDENIFTFDKGIKRRISEINYPEHVNDVSKTDWYK